MHHYCIYLMRDYVLLSWVSCQLSVMGWDPIFLYAASVVVWQTYIEHIISYMEAKSQCIY